MLSYYFTARPDEKLLRPHLIIRGTGKVSVSKVIVKELSGEELRKREEAGKAAMTGRRIKMRGRVSRLGNAPRFYNTLYIVKPE